MPRRPERAKLESRRRTLDSALFSFRQIIRDSDCARRAVSSAPAFLLFLIIVTLIVAGPVAGQATITILSPQSGDTIQGATLTITGSATDAVRVQVCIENVRCVNATSVDSWSVSFDLSLLPAANYTITACAFPSSGPPACKTVLLELIRNSQIVQTVQEIQTLLESRITPILALAGVAVTVLVAAFPHWYRVGGLVAELLSAVVLLSLVIHFVTTEFSLYYGSAAALFVAVLGVNRFSRSKVRTGVT